MTRIVEKGFTLVETLVALAIAGVLVAIAVPSYKFYVARTQVTESLSSASMQSFSVAQNLKRGRCTTVAGVNDVYPNRFGTLTISGAKVTSKGENCPSGCTATFLFNDTTEKHLQGKQVVFNILNNQKVSFVSSTVDSLYLPKELKTISTTTTDNCTAIPDQPLTPTDGSTPGGSTTNTTPTAPTPTNPTPTTPPNPTNPTDPTDPGNGSNITDPTNPNNPTEDSNVIVSPAYSAGYYNAISGGTKVTRSGSSQTKYLRFKLDKIPAGTVLTLKAGPHGTPVSRYYTDFTVLKANGAIDSSNGVTTRMYGDGSPNREITLTFPNAVINPTEFVIAVNIWNVIYNKDKYGTHCTNYVYQGSKAIVAEKISLTWATNY